MTHSRHPTSRGCRALALVALALVAWTASPAALAAPSHPVVQVTPPQPLPPTVDLDAIAAQTAALHRANGGATVNLFQGDLAGQELYVVIIYPELSEAVPGPDIDPARIRQFITDHLSLLTEPRNNVGTWFNDEDGYTYLDVATALPDRAQALALGQQYNQMGVFDLSQMTMIDVGGTGTVPANLPPIDQRLPPLPGELAPPPAPQ
jgi:hypothetical protein